MSAHAHLFPIIDLMVQEAITEVESGKDRISCHAGCSYCCNLLVEVSWEEAESLAGWIERQPAPRRRAVLERLAQHVNKVQNLFKRWPSTKQFLKPSRNHAGFPSFLFDRYFYDEPIPCPFLEDGKCSAYEARPTPCRLHLVTSAPRLCASDVRSGRGYKVPRRIERLRDEAAPVIQAVHRDHRWGHLGIMVDAALRKRLADKMLKPKKLVAESSGTKRNLLKVLNKSF